MASLEAGLTPSNVGTRGDGSDLGNVDGDCVVCDPAAALSSS